MKKPFKKQRLCKWHVAGLFAAPLLILLAFLHFSEKPPLLQNVSFGRIALDCNGRIIRLALSVDQKHRYKIGLDQIPAEAIRSLLHYEDRHFYSHPGINPLSLLRASLATLCGGRKLGASTITMQVARMRHNLKTNSLPGKLRQIWHALVLERHYSKAEILEAYFNLAPYGGNVEGLEAAARIYFHKAASDLSTSEIHALTVVPQNPSKRHPVEGADFQAAMMRLEESLSDSQLPTSPLPRAHSATEIPFSAPHFSNLVLDASEASILHTTLDSGLQRRLERKLKQFQVNGRRIGLENAAAMIVNYESMEVVALAGSSDFFDAGISGQIDGTGARRSPGSTLKPFIYALALDQGLIHPGTILSDSPKSFGGYDPENFDKGFRGPVSAKNALAASRNLPAISLAEQLSGPDLYKFLISANVRLEKDAEYYGLALTLGGAEISMRELAALYAMLANGGQWQPLRFFKNSPHAPGKRLLSPEAAWLALWMLEKDGLEALAGNETIPLRCKTGTSNGFRDAWTAGIIGPYVVITWAGNFDNAPNTSLVGALAALPLFADIAQDIVQIKNITDNFPLKSRDLNLRQTPFCETTGDFELEHCPVISTTWVIPGVSPARSTGVIRPALINKESGLRACRERQGQTEKIWLEFWPSDMRQIFALAGIHKPLPPEWEPECRAHYSPLTKKPRITLPKKNVKYLRRLPDGSWTLPLQAAADQEVKKLFWYADEKFLGSTRPGAILSWQAPPGRHLLRVVDDRGESASQLCAVEAVP